MIDAAMSRLGRTYESVEQYLEDIKAELRKPSPKTRSYSATQDSDERWQHLSMPTLLLRATRELRDGSGFIVPADDRDRFVCEVPHATVAEIDANHLTINTHPATAVAIKQFLTAPSRHS